MKDCPVCLIPLKEVPRYGVLVDVCPGCKGVWLDRGELEKVVSLAREFHNDYEDINLHYKQHHGYHHKKKKHGIFEIFGELFD